jgi:hypothetical protein
MKVLSTIAVGLLLILAMAACGGKAGIAPAYQLAYHACIENVIADDGFTEDHAERHCTCLINKLAKDYTGTELYAIINGEGFPVPGVMETAVECASK